MADIKELAKQLAETKLCLVPLDEVENFCSYCKEQNITPHGGALNFEDGCNSKYFYTE